MALYLSGDVGREFQVWPVAGTLVTIGRSSRSGMQIADPTVSKEHAELTNQGGRWFIRDLGSRNGTRVNGVEAVEPLEIKVGDRLEVGQVPLAITAEHPAGQLRLNESSSLGSSVRLKVEQLLERPTTERQATGEVVRLLQEAGKLLVLPRPLKETCDEILQFVERAVPASRYVLLLQQESRPEPVQIAARTRSGRADEPLALSRSIIRMVMGECTSVMSGDAAVDPRFQSQQSIVMQGVRSAMAVPLFDNEKVLGLIYVDSQLPHITFTESQLELLSLLANMAAVKISNARLLDLEQARARMAQELATATQIQRSLLPPPPRMKGLEIDAHLQTCYEVGGDLYDFHVREDGRLLYVIGDVSGKGMGAAMLMSSFVSSARVLYDLIPNMGDLASRLNALICRVAEGGHFITGFLGSVDPETGQMEYVNAGHPPGVLSLGGESRELPGGGLPWGVAPGEKYTSSTTELRPGELLTLFTDGIPEARHGESFFDEERLYTILRGLSATSDLADARHGILEQVEAFLQGGPREDDTTLLLIRRS